MTQAIDMLKKAKAQASGDEAQLIEIELLAKEVSAVNMQTTMMMVMQDLGHKYQAILGRATKGKQKLMADRKATFQSAYEQMQREQMTISQQAQTLLSESQQQATTTMNLVSAEGSITRMAKAAKSQDIDKLTATTSDLNDLLSKYAKRINEYKLN
jgi:thymidylate kinase